MYFLTNTSKLILAGGGRLILPIVLLFTFYICYHLFSLFIFLKFKAFFKYFSNIIILYFCIFLIMFCLGFVLKILFQTANINDVINSSFKLIDIDSFIFREYPFLWFHYDYFRNETINKFLINLLYPVYFSLAFSMSILWIISLYKNIEDFYKLNFSILFALALALPIWA